MRLLPRLLVIKNDLKIYTLLRSMGMLRTSFTYVYICPLQLVEACRTGDVRAVQQLLSRGVGVNVEYVHVYVEYGEACTCVY